MGYLIHCFHHGSTPKKNVNQMITLYQIGCKAEGVPTLKLPNRKQVKHFDKGGMTLSLMQWFMKVVKHLAVIQGIWKAPKSIHFWNEASVSGLWDGVWDDLAPKLKTETINAKASIIS